MKKIWKKKKQIRKKIYECQFVIIQLGLYQTIKNI